MLQDLFPQARIYSMYGLTECKRCTYLPPEDLDRKPTSVGIAIPNTELWIVDEHDRRVGPDVVGQLVIRGATVMKGYWEKPEATARKLKPGPLPGEQVLYTGDFCRLDDEGYLYFVGRDGRHHQVARREGGAEGGRERAHGHPGREGGRGHRRARRDPRPGGQGVRRDRGGKNARRKAASEGVPEAPRELHGAEVHSDRAKPATDGYCKAQQESAVTGYRMNFIIVFILHWSYMPMLLNGEPLETYRKQIREFLLSNFYVAETTALDVDTSLLDQGIIDSTGVLEVIGFIEETFGITVEDSELLPENLDSIEGIAQYVIRKSNPVPLRDAITTRLSPLVVRD